MPNGAVGIDDQMEFSDADWRAVAKGDQSKKVKLDLSGLTTATTRTITIPDHDVPLADFVGDSGSGGTRGLVPAPGTGDAAANKFLKASGAWATLPANGSTALGTVATTSGSTWTLSGLTLTSYKFLLIVLNGVSTNNAAFTLTFNAKTVTSTASSQAQTVSGTIIVDLGTGVFSGSLQNSSGGNLASGGASGLTTASTSVALSAGAGTGDAGSFSVYGIQ